MNQEKLQAIKKSVLVFDIETSSQYLNGELIDIQENFEDYVKHAKVKWLGMYSYLHDEYNEINVQETDPQVIQDYIEQHDVLVGFNNEEFDTPIMFNNGLMPDKYFNQVDCLVTLGSATFYKHDGLPFKNRGGLMGYKFKKNSLKVMAETMGLETQKGDIDYMIFLKNFWTDEETAEIKKYLRADVEATKQMFDKLWDFWLPFTEFIPEKSVEKLNWIKSSIASLTYQAACHVIGVEPTYSEKSHDKKEEMGGRVIEPKYEEARNVWYVDFASLYPHIFCQFNLFNEVDENRFQEMTVGPMGNGGEEHNIWHGNDLFQVRGYYDISQKHPLSHNVAEMLRKRAKLKKEDPDNPLIYTYKIFLNGLYGAVRSEIFEQIHTPNAGWDCCWLGQQIQEYTEKRMKDFGFETIAGDTDSIFVVLKNDIITIPDEIAKTYTGNTTEEYVKHCLKTIVTEIKENVPFPAETFDIDIEDYIDYIMWPFSEEPVQGPDGKNLKNEKGRLIKERKGKKKNYCYITHKEGEKKLKLKGLPVIKDNATELGYKILQETLKPLILERMRAKFSRKEMTDIINDWLAKPEAMKLLAREYKVKPNSAYKPNKDGSDSNNIYAQISRGYFGGQAGVISLIKNKKVGNAGKTSKYCTYEEAVENGLQIKDLDLTKLKNELEAFVEVEK